uniref:TRAF3-interacting JNK-activating modulator-like isoform X2 n=1 Tax=Doryrhamphus excisus TaxID=161450 RepID=UPI0025AE6B9B|nr:TRAF3-interacting JNK-activating modulator-like isoform X2 [Doryrhamphus excisus]
MDALGGGGRRVSPLEDFDRKLEIRTEKHERLRRRTNVTSCRSPVRDDDTFRIKHRLKEKRQSEFLRRRRGGSSSGWLSGASGSTWGLQSRPNTDDWMMMMMEEDITMESVIHDTIIGEWLTDVKGCCWPSHQSPPCLLDAKTMRSEAGVQTHSGLVTIKECDVLQLQEYLQEALWREETIKKKLSALQESIAQLLSSFNTIWKSRPNEDVLRNKIQVLEDQVLEGQLQASVPVFPKDATRKLLLQMKKQKVVYEEKSQEKNQALSKTGEALVTAKVDILRLHNLYEELKHTSEKLRQQQDFSTDQLRQQQVQIELSRCREAALTEELVSLRQEKKELEFNIGLLEEYNGFLRDKQHRCGHGDAVGKDAGAQETPEEEVKPKRDVMVDTTPKEGGGAQRDSDLQGQIDSAQKEVGLKGKEWEVQPRRQELQSQRREDLWPVSHHRKRLISHASWWSLSVLLLLLLLLLLLAVGGAALLWHLPAREQMEDLYSDIGRQIEDYFMQMSSPKHPGCFRPF